MSCNNYHDYTSRVWCIRDDSCTYHTHMHTRMHARMHTRMCACAHVHTCMHTHVHTHTCTHTHMHTHTCTHGCTHTPTHPHHHHHWSATGKSNLSNVYVGIAPQAAPKTSANGHVCGVRGACPPAPMSQLGWVTSWLLHTLQSPGAGR